MGKRDNYSGSSYPTVGTRARFGTTGKEKVLAFWIYKQNPRMKGRRQIRRVTYWDNSSGDREHGSCNPFQHGGGKRMRVRHLYFLKFEEEESQY